MDQDHLLELSIREAGYWWHVNRRRLIMVFLRKLGASGISVLEVGCGGGLLSSLLSRNGFDVVAADIDLEAARFAREKGVTKSVSLNAGQPWPFKNGSFQVVIMLDVLEHVKDDARCLAEARRVLSPDGMGVVMVPAHPFLYSDWDRVLGHHRRYSASMLRSVIENAGYRIDIFSYHNALSFPLALFLRGSDRLMGRRFRRAEFPDIPNILNKGLKCWGRVECALIPLKIPFGLSLFTIIKPKAEDGFSHA